MSRPATRAPNGSPFIDENSRLTPAWHNYLAAIETLTKTLTNNDIGAQLAALVAGIDALEAQVASAEAQFRDRNWEFAHFDNPEVRDSGGVVRIEHGMGTRKIIARAFNNDYSGGNSSAQSFVYLAGSEEDIVDVTMTGATYGGSGNPEAWVLAFYD